MGFRIGSALAGGIGGTAVGGVLAGAGGRARLPGQTIGEALRSMVPGVKPASPPMGNRSRLVGSLLGTGVKAPKSSTPGERLGGPRMSVLGGGY